MKLKSTALLALLFFSPGAVSVSVGFDCFARIVYFTNCETGTGAHTKKKQVSFHGSICKLTNQHMKQKKSNDTFCSAQRTHTHTQIINGFHKTTSKHRKKNCKLYNKNKNTGNVLNKSRKSSPQISEIMEWLRTLVAYSYQPNIIAQIQVYDQVMFCSVSLSVVSFSSCFFSWFHVQTWKNNLVRMLRHYHVIYEFFMGSGESNVQIEISRKKNIYKFYAI